MANIMKVISHANTFADLSRMELVKIMITTLKNCPQIMMIPVEKLSLVGYVISAPRSTAMTMLGILANPMEKQRTAAIQQFWNEKKHMKQISTAIEAMHWEIIAFLYA